MKNLLFIFTLLLTLAVRQNVWAQCHSGSYTVTNNTVITGSCIITGDLTIRNGATLNVDLTSAAADTFVVRGNIVLQGSAVLWVHGAPGSAGEQFIVSNSYNNQRTITTNDSSRIMLEYVEFRTQEGNLANAASVYMNYNAAGRSLLYVNKSWLDPQKAWLLCNMKSRSTLLGQEPNHIPSEIYLQDTAGVALHGPNTNTGIWLNFASITGALNLPPDQTQPYTWKIGRGLGGLNTPWYFEVDTAKPGLGVQIFPTSKMTVHGTGLPATGELKVALMFANGSDTLKNLTVGLQHTTVADGTNGSVTLNNVNLGPIAWQLYALMNENLYVKRSIINEIGIAGPSNIVVDSSLLQLAVLAAVGTGGSTMTINNTEIWNQAITAANSSSITLNNCNVNGSVFSTDAAPSHIIVNGGCFFPNSTGCTQATMVNISTGQPYCNPFIPPGLPKILTPATIALNGVSNNCTTGIAETANSRGVTIFPTPSDNLIHVNLANPNPNYSIEIYSTLGQQVLKTADQTTIDLSHIPNGIYIVMVKQGEKMWTTKIVKQ